MSDESVRQLIDDTTERQRTAADPATSVWVSANAGTGKTHVLTQRVLRLLLTGTPPESLLCLTYTKAAASEMSRRVFDRLADWVVASDEALQSDLTRLNGTPPTADDCERARTLFAIAIETPGGLKVQTIHAFCERLLQRFPLEAGIAPNFEVLDEVHQEALVRDAVDEVLHRVATSVPQTEPLHDDLRQIIAFAIDDAFDERLVDLVRRRAAVQSFVTLAEKNYGRDAAGHVNLHAAMRDAFGLAPDVLDVDLADAQANLLSQSDLTALASWLGEGKSTDQAIGEALAAAARAPNAPARAKALEAAFLTSEGKPRSATRFVTKGLREQDKGGRPDLADQIDKAKDSFTELAATRRALAIATATAALLRVGSAVIQAYEAAKAATACADYDDLIAATARFLAEPERSQWALYKLDQGLDHILVDEAQDTSPEQWQVITALANEFVSGEGAREDLTRTIFAVGDEKQSIYSFQGAEPEEFAEMGRQFADRLALAGGRFQRIPLNLSFRTVAPILEAVDDVFRDADATPGLTADATQPRPRHDVKRQGQAGRVELWELEPRLENDATLGFDMDATADTRTPAERLAERVAETISHWLQEKRLVPSLGRPVQPGDIIVLLRKRHPLATVVIRALKARGIPVAGADRIRLAEQIGVMDLLALADFVLLPEDDLALATVLKSPLVGLNDDDLFVVGHDRRGSLWQALLAHRTTNARFADAAEALMRWRSQADFAPPYEFFSLVLDRDGGRRRMAERLGPEAMDAIDAFLELAIAFDESSSPSLQLYVEHVRRTVPEIKRDMDEGIGEVRIMTVHGAKGLEAPIVFLPDANGPVEGRPEALVKFANKTKSNTEDQGSRTGSPSSTPLAWAIKGASKNERVDQARRQIRKKTAEEANRLLYVAMTRARDELYVGGVEYGNSNKPQGWYKIIAEALGPSMVSETDHAGRTIRVRAAPQSDGVPPDGGSAHAAPKTESEPLPDWIATKVTRTERRSIPVTPSRLVPLDEADYLAEQVERPSAGSPFSLGRDAALTRGHLAHVLLQTLPDISPADRANVTTQFLKLRAPEMIPLEQAALKNEVLAVLDAPHLAPLFGSASVAEVPVVAELTDPSATARTISVNGVVDRLAVTETDVLIADYKTNRMPPTAIEDVPESYILQLAAYRAVLSEIYPGRRIRAALVWTAGPVLLEIPNEVLEASTPRLWMSRQG